jgi:hypothetical protein
VARPHSGRVSEKPIGWTAHNGRSVIVWCSLLVLVLRWNAKILLWMLGSVPVAVALSYACQLLIPIDGSVIIELLFAFGAVFLSGCFVHASPI